VPTHETKASSSIFDIELPLSCLGDSFPPTDPIIYLTYLSCVSSSGIMRHCLALLALVRQFVPQYSQSRFLPNQGRFKASSPLVRAIGIALLLVASMDGPQDPSQPRSSLTNYFSPFLPSFPSGRERWVWYANKKQEASTIPPEWHQWLHHVVDEIPSQAGLAAFRPHFLRGRTPNQTGTSKAYSSPHYLGNKSWTGGPSKKYESWDANAGKASSSSEASSSSTAL
jgi:NADH:ubiquinone oxidoreductase subunit